MMRFAKGKRRRVANFTPEEKALLAQLIKKRPILQSKLTDNKSVAKKQEAWESLTQEFNSKAHDNQRETITLKRAWDNLKASARNAQSIEHRNLLRSHRPSPPPQRELISMVEDPMLAVSCQINNNFDSDGTVLNEDTSQETEIVPDLDYTRKPYFTPVSTNHEYEPIDFAREEATIRKRHLENKNKMELQILQTQLEIEEIKRRSVLLEEDRNRILLQKAKLELNNGTTQ